MAEGPPEPGAPRPADACIEAGRAAATGPGPGPDPADFLSGETGHVAGLRRTLTRSAGDALLDLLLKPHERALDRLASATPPRDVLALSIYRPQSRHIAAATTELGRTHHRLQLALGATGEPSEPHTVRDHLAGGKFQNLNELLTTAATEAGGPAHDWLLVLDDDVRLPRAFLDRLIALCEHFGLKLAQPAQTLMSHAAWRVTRRRPGSLVRETRFVEIGPVTVFSREAAALLTPFPADLRYGWGLDLHWAALAAERGWRIGVIDALPVRHEQAPVASAYGHQEAIEEAKSFLAGRPFVPASEAPRTLVTHRSLAR